MNKELFEKSFLGKTVRAKGEYYQIPPGKYICTAALYEFDPDDVTILAIIRAEETDDCPWFTIHIAKEDFPKAIRDFEVLD